jgi:hypothetical protein
MVYYGETIDINYVLWRDEENIERCDNKEHIPNRKSKIEISKVDKSIISTSDIGLFTV